MSFPYLAAISDRAVVEEYASTKSFNIGNLGMTEDGSLWRLCKAGAALSNTLTAKINYYHHLTGVTGSSAEAALTSGIAVGDTDYTFDDATNSRAANYYKGGICCTPSVSYDGIRRIWKSDAEVSDTYKIYVTAPFTIAYASGTIHTYPSPYNDIRNAQSYAQEYEQFACCIERSEVDSGKYFWGKVRGPHWMWVQVAVWPGAAANDRTVYFYLSGGIHMLDAGLVTAVESPQIAGRLMYSGNYGDALIYLEIE